MPALIKNPDGSPHTHEFVRRKDKKTNIPTDTYFCAHPNCFARDMHKKMLKGKESVCAVCHKNKLILTFQQLKLARPRCHECSESAEAKRLRENKEILAGLGIK